MTYTSSDGPLARLLRQYADREWLFVSPGGNWGDQLIYEGAYALARRLNLNWKAVDFGEFDAAQVTTGSALYLQGGGGFNPWGSRRAFTHLKAAVGVPEALVIQGPQTCDVEDARTAELFADCFADVRAAKVHLYARERTSYNYISRLKLPAIDLQLDHDTALHLTQVDLLALGGLSELPAGRYSLLVSRSDDEAPELAPVRSGVSVTLDPAYFANSLAHWVRVHAQSSQITTNRLHSAIGAHILGRPVVLLPGSYHKNRSVWEHSLESRGVQWANRVEHTTTTGFDFDGIFPEWVARSWKVQRLGLWLRGVPMR